MPPETNVGDVILFEIEPPRNDNASPLCKNIRKAPPEIVEAVLAKGIRDKGKGKGGKCGKDKAGLSGDVARGIMARGAVMRMTGIVKRPSVNTGRFFVFCQDISDVYGKDCQIPPDELPKGVELKLGDRIAFDVEELTDVRNGTPWARNVTLLSKLGDTKKKNVAVDDGEDEKDGDAILEEHEEEDDAKAAPEAAEEAYIDE